MQDIHNRLLAAVRPTTADLDLASNVIMSELSGGGVKHTRNLMDQVARAMEVQALEWQDEEGVSRADVLRARAFGTTITALAHLESSGHVLPFGNQRLSSSASSAGLERIEEFCPMTSVSSPPFSG